MQVIGIGNDSVTPSAVQGEDGVPRFYFHLQGGGSSPDTEGTVLPGLDEARAEAVRFAAELLRDAPQTVWSDDGWSLVVTDEHQLTLFNLTMIATHAPSTGQHARCMPDLRMVAT